METRNRSIQLFSQEPFRLFFPVGLLLGMVGVALWPLYHSGLFSVYPATAHARLMIEGFMASFIIGFLGTAGPRMTSTRHLSRSELITLLTLDLLAAGLHVGGSHRAGDILFTLCLLFFVSALARRFVRRQDSPPPTFALVGLGLVNGLTGALLLVLSEDKMYSAQYRLGTLLLEQGFVLLPILGVAPFLLARLLDIPGADQSNQPGGRPSSWITPAVFAATIGIIIDLTFVAESIGLDVLAGWVRLGAILAYLIARLPRQGRTFLGDAFRAGIAAVIVGIGVETLWPQYRIGALHIVFISGFGFIVLTVATRVVFGHSGNAHLFRKRLPFFVVVGALIFVAALTRYIADLSPGARTVHLVAAALFWLIAALIWMGKVIPKVAIPDLEN